MRELADTLKGWRQHGRRVAVATLVAVQGSAPRRSGARMLVSDDGSVEGSVSGGCVESDLARVALDMIASGEAAKLLDYELATSVDSRPGAERGPGATSCGSISVLVEVLAGDEPALDLALAELAAGRACSLVTALPPGSGRLCIDHDDNRAGDMQGSLGALTAAQLRDSSEVFFEELEPDEPLYIVGATDTAAQLCRMASATGFAVTVIDPRAAFARPDRFQDARALLCEWPQAVFKREDLPVTASVVTLSHDEKFDMPALEAALAADIRYVGALGSRATQARRRSELASRGVAEEQLDSIHGPVGLDLGGREPAEIAVAVLAELVAARHGRALS